MHSATYGSVATSRPVTALRAWVAVAEGNEEPDRPLFRPINRHGQLGVRPLTAQSVALILKDAAGVAGLDPTTYAGHSLRAGHATSAAAQGAPERAIMKTTGHRTERMVRRYIRNGELLRDNSAATLGL